MKDTFWMFAVMLMLITLISSLGGGIRYRENFVDEVLDNDDSADPPQGYDYYPMQHPTEVGANEADEDEGANIVKKTVSFENDLKIDEESLEEDVVEEEEQGEIVSTKVPIKLEKPVAVPSNHTSTNEFIVPYGGEFYAPF